MNKNEIIDHINHIANRLEQHGNSIKKSRTLYTYDKSMLNKISDDTKISYRTLYKLLRKNCFNINLTLENIIDNKNNSVDLVNSNNFGESN